MKRLLAAAAVCVLAWLAAPAAQTTDARVIMISVDGLMPSAYTNDQARARVPRIAQLAGSGVWANGMIGVTPTVTYPSHTTLITGVEPARHGIVDNRILDPENQSGGAWFWYARDIKVPTLPSLARARGLRAAGVNWPVTVGMDLDAGVPEFFRSRHPEALSMLRALSTPRTLIDDVEAARGKPFSWLPTDDDRAELAAYVVAKHDPHLLLVHLIDLDTAQHTYGPGSPQALETLAKVDAGVGRIVDAVRTAGRGDRTHILVVSDHGFLPLENQVQPNALFKREGLLSVNERGDIVSWQAYFHSSGGAGFVYLKDAASRSRVHGLLQALQKDPANGIREIWTAEQLAARGAHPAAAFGLDVVDGFYTGSGHDVLVKPSASKGGHGFAPERPALHASFVMTGPTVKKRGSLGIIRMTSVAPTIAAILGIKLPSSSEPLSLGTGVAGGKPELQRFEAVEPHMGTLARITVYTTGEEAAREAFRAGFNRISQLNHILSDYLPESELNQITRIAVGRPVPVSDDLFAVLRASQELAQASDGAFDITQGPVVRLWREARKTGRAPDRTVLSEAASRTGFRKLHIENDSRSVALEIAGMALDAGAIGKGYAASEAIEAITRRGVRSALVAISGDLAFSDAPPGRRGWRVQVHSEDPSAGAVPDVLELTNAAVSTSGNAEQHVDIDGRRYSHVVDPASSMGLVRDITVTVVARHGLEADGLDTAVAVLGADRGLPLVESRGAAALVIEGTAAGTRARTTRGFPAFSRERDMRDERRRTRD